jgi:hypothetical protein
VVDLGGAQLSRRRSRIYRTRAWPWRFQPGAGKGRRRRRGRFAIRAEGNGRRVGGVTARLWRARYTYTNDKLPVPGVSSLTGPGTAFVCPLFHIYVSGWNSRVVDSVHTIICH